MTLKEAVLGFTVSIIDLNGYLAHYTVKVKKIYRVLTVICTDRSRTIYCQ